MHWSHTFKAMALTHLVAFWAPISGFADTVIEDATQRFTLEGTRLVFDGRVEREEGSRDIDYEDSHELRTFLFEHPEIELLEIHSGGGQVTAALDMAAVVAGYEIDKVVKGRCASACTFVFLAGANRTLKKGGRLEFTVLGPVDIHREAMMVAARCQLAA